MWIEYRGIKVAVDVKYDVFVNDVKYLSVVASPDKLEELAIGMLYGDGLISSASEVESCEVKGNEIKVCLRDRSRAIAPRDLAPDERAILEGHHVVRSAAKFRKRDVERLFSEFSKLTTGPAEHKIAVHTSAIFVDGRWYVAYDVSRHAGVLKTIGMIVKEGVEASSAIAFTSGRASSDMVARLARLNVPLVATFRGPLYSGLLLAEKLQMTLLCNVKGRGLVPLTNEWRLIE